MTPEAMAHAVRLFAAGVGLGVVVGWLARSAVTEATEATEDAELERVAEPVAEPLLSARRPLGYTLGGIPIKPNGHRTCCSCGICEDMVRRMRMERGETEAEAALHDRHIWGAQNGK